MDDLKERLRKASAYLSDHHGLLLEDDQMDLLCADCAKAADRIEKLEAALQAIADFTADENVAVPPYTQIALFAKELSRATLSDNGGV